MTFALYWKLLLKRWKIVLLCFIVVGLGTYGVSRLLTPLYQSSALVQIAIRSGGTNQADYTSLLASNQLVQTESELAISIPVLKEVASRYPGMSVDQLAKEATSSVKLNTQLFEIDVLDPNSVRAAALANDIANTTITQQLQSEQLNNQNARGQIQDDLDSTQKQIDSTTSLIAQLQAQATALSDAIHQNEIQAQNLHQVYQPTTQQLKQQSDLQSQIAVQQAQLTRSQNHFDQWQTALSDLVLAEAQSGNFLRVAQAAVPSLSPARPQILLNTGIGLLAGLLLGLLMAVLFEQLDTRVRTAEALTQMLDWPVLATIWKSSSDNLINPINKDVNVEAYRALRTNIGFSVVDKQLRTIVITSATPQEGKSVTAANLAIFMAKAGKNTLLVDADLRRPTQHEKFGLPGDRMGLSNAIMAISQHQYLSSVSTVNRLNVNLAPSFSLEPYMHSVAIPNLRVMPTGPLPPNPSELLDSKAMKRLLVALENCGAEIVIFDTPPLLGLSETSILVSMMDGTILVVDATRNNKSNLKQVKELLVNAGGHVLGCVMNKQKHSRKDTTYYYYYYRSEEQTSEANHNAQNGHKPAAAVAPSVPITPDMSRPPK